MRFLVLFLFSSLVFAPPPLQTVTYLTDVEGILPKYENFFANNDSFEKGPDRKFHLKPGAAFVYGGDSIGRGSGAYKIMADLIRLKEESGENVAILMGNRELWEMSGAKNIRPKTGVPGELWMQQLELNAKRIAKKKGGDVQQIVQELNTPKNRKAFAIRYAFGDPNAMEKTRDEIASKLGKGISEISDLMVIDQIILDHSNNGRVAEFLSHGQIAARFGNTLFVHGGVMKEAIKQVPDKTELFNDSGKWIGELNSWYKGQIAAWRKDPTVSISEDGAMEMVFGKNSDAYNNPILPDQETIDWLMGNGIRRVVIGHTPTGEAPVIIRSANGFEVISADNSYAANESLAHQITFKGPGFSTADISFEPLSVPGINGPVRFQLTAGEKSLIGKRLPTGSVVVAKVELPGKETQYVTFHLGEKFAEQYALVPESVLSKEQLIDPVKPHFCAPLGKLGELADSD